MVEFISSDDWDLCKQQFKATTFIGKEPVVKPWNPRSKTGAAVWQAEVEDLLVWHGLREAAVGGPPTLQECKARCPSMSDNQLIDFLTACEQHYSMLNREVYFLIKPTLIFAGEHADSDAATVQRRFGSGEARDGHGLLQWAQTCSAGAAADQGSLYTKFATAKIEHFASFDAVESQQTETHADVYLPMSRTAVTRIAPLSPFPLDPHSTCD